MSNTPERLSAEEIISDLVIKIKTNVGTFYMVDPKKLESAIEQCAETAVASYADTIATNIIVELKRGKEIETDRDQLRAELKEVTRQRDEAIELLKELKTYIWDSTVDNSISHFLSQLENKQKDGK
jgi:hypothetical protein